MKLMIDITPTWSGLLPALLDLLQSKKPDVRQQAYDELVRMAKAADLFNKSVKEASSK